MSYAERTMTEPYTSREVRTVPGEGGANLPPQDGKAVPPYSTRRKPSAPAMISTFYRRIWRPMAGTPRTF